MLDLEVSVIPSAISKVPCRKTLELYLKSYSQNEFNDNHSHRNWLGDGCLCGFYRNRSSVSEMSPGPSVFSMKSKKAPLFLAKIQLFQKILKKIVYIKCLTFFKFYNLVIYKYLQNGHSYEISKY